VELIAQLVQFFLIFFIQATLLKGWLPCWRGLLWGWLLRERSCSLLVGRSSESSSFDLLEAVIQLVFFNFLFWLVWCLINTFQRGMEVLHLFLGSVL